MRKKEKVKVDFDLSKLTVQQLIEVYNNINDFLDFLEENKIDIEEKGEENE